MHLTCLFMTIPSTPTKWHLSMYHAVSLLCNIYFYCICRVVTLFSILQIIGSRGQLNVIKALFIAECIEEHNFLWCALYPTEVTFFLVWSDVMDVESGHDSNLYWVYYVQRTVSLLFQYSGASCQQKLEYSNYLWILIVFSTWSCWSYFCAFPEIWKRGTEERQDGGGGFVPEGTSTFEPN
jgi:hypothetical protein